MENKGRLGVRDVWQLPPGELVISHEQEAGGQIQKETMGKRMCVCISKHSLKSRVKNYINTGNSLAVQWWGLHCCTAGDTGSITGQITKTPQAMQHGQKQTKKPKIQKKKTLPKHIQAPGIGDGQGSLACSTPWGRKELDTTVRLNWSETYTHTPSLSSQRPQARTQHPSPCPWITLSDFGTENNSKGTES